jgi:hypothetical protein
MSTSRSAAIRARAASVKTPRERRDLVDELTDELVSLRVTEPPGPEDPEVLRTLISLVVEDPTGEIASIAAEVLSLAGHRRAAGRSDLIDGALVQGLTIALDRVAGSRDVRPLVSAIEDLSATRPISAAIAPVRQLLIRSREETEPYELTLDSALAIVRWNFRRTWIATINSWFPDLRDDEPLSEAVRLADQNESI